MKEGDTLRWWDDSIWIVVEARVVEHYFLRVSFLKINAYDEPDIQSYVNTINRVFEETEILTRLR